MTRGIRSRTAGMSLSAVTITALSILALALPAAGRAVVNIEGITPQQLPDYDSRASVAPSADQLAAANALGADVSWNRFGVASSVSNGGDYVTKGLQAPDAVSAARNWLEANKALFRLDSTDSLAAVTLEAVRRARRTTTRSCSGSRRTASHRRTASRPSRSSARRTQAGTSRMRPRASRAEARTRPGTSSSHPPKRGRRPRKTSASNARSSTSRRRARRPAERRSSSAVSRRNSTSRRPCSRRRTRGPGPRTTRPSRPAPAET